VQKLGEFEERPDLGVRFAIGKFVQRLAHQAAELVLLARARAAPVARQPLGARVDEAHRVGHLAERGEVGMSPGLAEEGAKSGKSVADAAHDDPERRTGANFLRGDAASVRVQAAARLQEQRRDESQLEPWAGDGRGESGRAGGFDRERGRQQIVGRDHPARERDGARATGEERLVSRGMDGSDALDSERDAVAAHSVVTQAIERADEIGKSLGRAAEEHQAKCKAFGGHALAGIEAGGLDDEWPRQILLQTKLGGVRAGGWREDLAVGAVAIERAGSALVVEPFFGADEPAKRHAERAAQHVGDYGSWNYGGPLPARADFEAQGPDLGQRRRLSRGTFVRQSF